MNGRHRTESDVERSFCGEVVAAGGVAYKFVSPGKVGVPDRIVLMPITDEKAFVLSGGILEPVLLRDLIARYVWFVELKSPTGKVSAIQAKRFSELNDLGYRVEVVKK